MEFKEFCEAVRNEIGEYLLQYDIEDVSVRQTEKNNGATMTGLVITQENSNIAPNIYLEGFYDRYRQGRSMQDILHEISGVYRDACMQIATKDMSFLDDADAYYDRVYLRVVSYEKNRDKLRGVPFRKYLDMAVTMRILASHGPEHTASAQMTYPMIARLELSQKQLWEHALANTKAFFPVHIEKMDDIIRKLAPEMHRPELPDMGIYVMTNTSMKDGATALLYAQEELDALARKNNTGYYILPSSVNEMLLVPEKDFPDAEELQEMVTLVNRNELREEEILSDSVYRYDKDSGEISMAYPNMEPEKHKDEPQI